MAKNRIRPKSVKEITEAQPEPELVSAFEGTPLPEQRSKKEKRGKPETAAERLSAEEKRERRRRRKEKFLAWVNGSVLSGERMQKGWGLLVFVFFLAIVMITANYMSERVIRESAAIKNELQDLHFKQVSSKAELMRISRQSSVAKMLDSTRVRESVTPPYMIK